MENNHIPNVTNEQFRFSEKAKWFSWSLIAIGILSVLYGIFDKDISEERIWANILIDGFFFFGIGLCAAFFMAVQHAAEAAWATVLKRIFEAVGSYMYVGWLLLIIAFAFGGHHIYHWMNHELYDPASPEYDKIIANKSAYLNLPFFWIRTCAYLIIWIGYIYLMRRRSLQEDRIGGTDIHYKNQAFSAAFLVLFAITSSTSAWDWIMSIDTHWYSTIFGWYTFSGIWISGLVVMTLLILYLKRKGYLQQVNASHLHDMGKWIFAISFLWSYLWFFQFMLIWYTDIPEEITYFKVRLDDYNVFYFAIVLINFALPMIFLMDRDNKRNPFIITAICIILILGHWSDVYMMITPGVLKGEGTIGLLEGGMFLGVTGLFIYFVLRTLSRAPLIVQKSPYLQESLDLQY